MDLSKNYFDQAQEAVEDYTKAIVPIFSVNFTIAGKRKTSYIGSSFYVEYKNNFFLITAYHVLKQANPLLVPFSETRIQSLKYDLEASAKNKDYDLTVLRLIDKIQDTRFIPYKLYETELDDNFLEPRLYIAFGFPGSKVNYYNKKMNGHFELFYTVKENKEEYERLKKNDNDYLLLQFNKNDVIVNGEKRIACHPNGKSGGCVVSLHPKLIIPIRFEGILIEWDVEKKKTMIAVRKQYVKYLLEQINKHEV
ncbi:hypothetical protein [Treponema sp.]|uniref:hypothetical protein n=1 Tax=Treponema sp. TaxID=166 RepID=UPI00298E1DC8|nr:hypothetical protein [Treponema sp.]